MSGQRQNVSVEVLDANSNQTIVGARVKGSVTYLSSGVVTKEFNGTTDSLGRVSYTWKISVKDKLGVYKTEVQVSALGYKNKSGVTTFKVNAPTPLIVTNNSTNSSPSSIIKLPFA
jgi:hypothetical protein